MRPTGREPPPSPRAQTLAFQGLANLVARGLLRTPLLCRLVGARLITIYVVGRKSGRHYAVPVAFTRHDGVLLVGTPFGWGRNLRTGEAVDIRLKGKRRRMDVVVVTDEDGVVENYAVMARGNRQFAKFNKISVDQAGEPNPADPATTPCRSPRPLLRMARATGTQMLPGRCGGRARTADVQVTVRGNDVVAVRDRAELDCTRRQVHWSIRT